MDAPGEGQERRPPPIRIPPSFPWPAMAPGPNAFAIAERAAKAKQDVEEKLGQAERLASHGEQYPYADQGSMSPGLRPKPAYSNLPGGVLKSPKKAGHPYASSSTSSQYSSASQSNVQPESRSMRSLQRQFGGLGGEKTARAAIEERMEPKLMKIMGQQDELAEGTPPESSGNIRVYDRRPGRGLHLGQESDHHEISSKSPRKKIFGVSIPFTSRSAPKIPTPPMKLKAARLMGVDPPPRNKKVELVANMAAGFAAARSETSKSLPAKMYNKADHHAYRRSPPHDGRRSPKNDRSPPLSRARRRTPPRHPTVFSHQKTLDALTGADQRDIPPIPPRKDSLPIAARKVATVAAENAPFTATKKITAIAPENTQVSDGDPDIMRLLNPPTPVLEPEDFTDQGMQVRPPSFPHRESSLYEEPGESPKKPQPLNIVSKANLVEGPQILSARAALEFVYSDDDELSPALASPTTMIQETLSYIHQGRHSAPVSPSTPWPTGEFAGVAQSNNNAPPVDFSASTAYVSSNAATRMSPDDSPTLPPAAFEPPPKAAVNKAVDALPALPPAAYESAPKAEVNKPVDTTVYAPPKTALHKSADLPTLLNPVAYAPPKPPVPMKVVPSTVLKSDMYIDPKAALSGALTRSSGQTGSDKPTPQPEQGKIPITFQGNVKEIDAQPGGAKDTGRADETRRYSPHHFYRQRVGDSEHIARVMAGYRVQPPGNVSGPVKNTGGGDVQKPVKNTRDGDVQKPVKNDVQKPEKDTVQKPVKDDVQKPDNDTVRKLAKNDVQKPVKNTRDGDVQKPVKNDVQKPEKDTVQKPVKDDVQKPDNDAVRKLAKDNAQKLSSGSPAPKPVPGTVQKLGSGGVQTGKPSTHLTPMTNSVGSSKANLDPKSANAAVSPWQRFGAKTPGSARTFQPPPYDWLPVAPDAPINEYFGLVNQHLDVVALTTMDNVNQKTNLAAQAMSLKQDQMQADIEQSLNQLKSLVNMAGHKSTATDKHIHDVSTKLDDFSNFIKTELVEPFAKQAEKIKDLEKSMKALEKTVKNLQTQTSAPQRSSMTSSYPSPQIQAPYFPDPRLRPTLPSFYDHNGPARPAMLTAAPGPVNLVRFASNTQPDRPPLGRDSRENNGLSYTPTPVEAYRNPGLGGAGYPQSYDYASMNGPSQQYGYGPGSQQ